MESITRFLTELLAGAPGGVGFVQAVSALALAYLGGVLSSLTPCVYPMIPITIGVVGGMGSAERNWRQIWLRGLAYVAGMAAIYSFLGVLAGLTGKVFGSLTQTSGWYIGLGLIITLAALVMLDVLPFDVPGWWDRIKRMVSKRRSGSASQTMTMTAPNREMTLAGAFALGASSGFIAAPCTTPVLTSILAYIAQTQSVLLGFGLMACFSLGLGTLLLLIAAFAGAVRILPRSGRWMSAVKAGSGLILLGFAEYLFYCAGTLGGR